MNDVTQNYHEILLLNPNSNQLQAMKAAIEQSGINAITEFQTSRNEIITLLLQALESHQYDVIFDYYERYAEAAAQDRQLLNIFEQARAESKSYGYVSKIQFIYQTLPRRIYDSRYALYAYLAQLSKNIDPNADWVQIPAPESCDDYLIGEPFDGMFELYENITKPKAFYPGFIIDNPSQLVTNLSSQTLVLLSAQSNLNNISPNSYYLDPETACRHHYINLASQGANNLTTHIHQFVTNAPLTDYAIQKFFALNALQMPELAQYYCLNRRQILTQLQTDIRELKHDNAETIIQTYHDIAVNLNDSSFIILETLLDAGIEIYSTQAELSLELNITPDDNIRLLYYNTQRLFKLNPANMEYVQGKTGILAIIQSMIQEKLKNHKYFELSLLYQKMYTITQNHKYLKLSQKYKKQSIHINEWQTLLSESDESDNTIQASTFKRIFAPDLIHSKVSPKTILSLIISYGLLVPFMGTILMTLLITTILAIAQFDTLTDIQKSLALASILDIPIAGFILWLNIPVTRTYIFHHVTACPILSTTRIVIVNIIAYFMLIAIRILFTLTIS